MKTQTLVFEIGVEEIPAMPLYSATEKLKVRASEALNAARISHGEVMTYSTPRRIILRIDDVAVGRFTTSGKIGKLVILLLVNYDVF